MWGYRLEYAWRTDQGQVRARNEDAVSVHPDLGLIVVADGIGGANAGDVASRLAAETIAERFGRQSISCEDAEKTRLFAEATIEEANIAVWRFANSQSGCSGMGTTVVLGVVGKDWLVIANVGDSRIYRVRNGAIEQLSRDHSLIQEVVDQGFFDSREEAKRCGIGENILTRALGSSPGLGITSSVVDIEPNDIFLFCTDGLTGMVPDDVLTSVLKSITANELDATAEHLVNLANEQGGNDNITLALLQIGERVKAGSAVGA